MKNGYTYAMNMESAKNEHELLRDKVASRIEAAKQNPILISRVEALENRLNELKDEFLVKGERSSELMAEEDEIEAEIFRSSAIADNLPEYSEMLSQISSTYGLSEEWAKDLLAHENAHANVAESTGHEWVGYGAIFMKDDSGELSNIQPLHFTRPDLSWGPREMIKKNIEVTEAPHHYDNTLSEGDKIDIARDKERLESLEKRKAQDEEDMDRIRIQLGLK